MRSMSRSPPRKAAQVGSLEMAAVAGACKVTNFSDPKLVTQKLLVTVQKLVTVSLAETQIQSKRTGNGVYQ